jgi:hypothetical protein
LQRNLRTASREVVTPRGKPFTRSTRPSSTCA